MALSRLERVGRDFDMACSNCLLYTLGMAHVMAYYTYRGYLLRGQIYLGANEYQEVVVDFRAAVTQGEGMNDIEYIERVRNLLGKAYYCLYNYTLALERSKKPGEEAKRVGKAQFFTEKEKVILHRQGPLCRLHFFHKLTAIQLAMEE